MTLVSCLIMAVVADLTDAPGMVVIASFVMALVRCLLLLRAFPARLALIGPQANRPLRES